MNKYLTEAWIAGFIASSKVMPDQCMIDIISIVTFSSFEHAYYYGKKAGVEWVS